MGVFDLFGRGEPKTKNERTIKEFGGVENIQASSKQGPISVFAPNSYSDVEVIIDSLKSGRTAIVHLKELKIETAVRVLDMLSGAIYALNGGVYEMEKNIFMFSPAGVEVR